MSCSDVKWCRVCEDYRSPGHECVSPGMRTLKTVEEKYRATSIESSFCRDAVFKANLHLERALAEERQAAADYINLLREMAW